MKLKGNEGLYYKGFITVTLFWKKIVNKEVLCNLQLSHKHSGHDYAKMVGKCEFDFTRKVYKPFKAMGQLK